MTGDVFDGISIPGIEGTGLAIILTHPCSMRVDGVNLTPRLLMARVVTNNPIPLKEWRKGHFKVMPLPDLFGTDKHHIAKFDEIGLVDSLPLNTTRRKACMAPHGVHLLQQRFIWYLTRFLAPTCRLAETMEVIFEEVELQEEWVEFSMSMDRDPKKTTEAFHDWIRSPDKSGISRQEQIKQADLRAGVRRQMKTYLLKNTSDSQD